MSLLLIILLAALAGLALGLLGGGGSILMVPILLFAAKMSPKAAIAMSLLVVGATSAVAVVAYARRGLVHWRTGLIFGAAAMVGAFGGGWVAQFIPGWILLVAFAGMMLLTAVAMLSSGNDPRGPGKTHLPLGLIAAEGIAVGAVTGMVGAGGGFLVVPALVVLGGLRMREAIGTSLLVIALKSSAGFAGYASHVSIDYTLALYVTGAAVFGAFAGAALGKLLSPNTLRVAFGWFVVVMALYMLGQQLPPAVTNADWFHAAFIDRWPWWIGGAAVGGFVMLFLRLETKLLGISTGYADLCSLHHDPLKRSSWRLPFIGGVVLGGLAAALIAGRPPTFALGAFDTLWSSSPLVKVSVLFAGGGMVGFGARTAGGCTSGHSIVGVAQGARSSLLATASFMVAGFGITQLLIAILGA